MKEITFNALLDILDPRTKVNIRINALGLDFETTHRAEFYKTNRETEYNAKMVTNIWIQVDGTLTVALEDI